MDRTIYFLRRRIRNILGMIEQHQVAKQSNKITPSSYVFHDNQIGELKEEFELMKQLIRKIEVPDVK